MYKKYRIVLVGRGFYMFIQFFWRFSVLKELCCGMCELETPRMVYIVFMSR